MEKIKDIKEFSEDGFAGYEIKTDKQSIKLTISNYQRCCERWGYFFSHDDYMNFVGSDILNITLTDDALNTHNLPDIYEGGIMFVNIETSKGTLQFTAYNEHNGYYGHEAKVECQQLEYSCSL